ncbi:unnamed protein product [Rotaria sordida]|uniref:Uncharacterized protein n=1 Tax=Rotaria sordida TaxID=392033 RepID=A0A815DL54_9BILA|nr:unnamed protein product [Rotaria sordida]
MDNDNQVWCIPNDCVPFIAAALSWHQRHINLGHEFILDTTDKILTQIRDLIDIDEPGINQDLLVANISEKIFFDYRSTKRNIDDTYEQGINEVFNQYKNIISSRVASGDIPDQCVKEIVCAIEQFKNRLLIRAEKMMNGNRIDQMFKLIENHLKEKEYNSKKLDSTKDEFKQLINNLLDNNEFNNLDDEKKADFVQTKFQKMILNKYNNDPNVQTIVDKTQSSTLPITRSYIEKLKTNQEDQKANLNEKVQSYQIKQQEQRDSIKSESIVTPKLHSSHQRTKKLNSNHDTTPTITKHISNDFNEKEYKQKFYHSRKENDYDSQQLLNNIISFTSK